MTAFATANLLDYIGAPLQAALAAAPFDHALDVGPVRRTELGDALRGHLQHVARRTR